jgi:hypothetical protein
MLLNVAHSNNRLWTHSVAHLGAILVLVALLAIGLYSVAREAGKLLQFSRVVATTEPAALVQESVPSLGRTL